MSTLTEPVEVTLEIEGMGCAACVGRVESALNDLDGVSATVNLATERATVRCDAELAVAELVAAVESAGYEARPAASRFERRDETEHHHYDEQPVLVRRLLAAVALSVPVALFAMVSELRPAGWEWISLGLSAPVVFYTGLGFHRTALRSARHGGATMDTLISLGTLAAWTWSAVVLIAGLETGTYFEVAAVVTTVILLGRYLETRARGRSSRAIKELLELGAKEAHVLRGGEELLVPVSELELGELFVVRPGSGSPRMASSSRASRRSTALS